MPYKSNKYDPFASEGKIELSFPALALWWKNGNGRVIPSELDEVAKTELRKKLGVTYYGGWCAHKSKADESLKDMGAVMLPGFSLVTMEGKEGAYDAYSARQITIVPLLKRIGWFKNQNDPTGKKQTSRHEILCYIATMNMQQKTFNPWGIGVISGSSFSGLAIINALSTWKRKIERLCSEEHPAWAHWVTIGTMRPNIYTEMRGKGNLTSPITPCEFYFPPEGPIEEFVSKRFIGTDLMGKCMNIREESQAWAEYWNERTEAMSTEQAGPDAPDNFAPEEASWMANSKYCLLTFV